MKLHRVQVSNYKSLSNVDVTLEPDVTVLVGQNASGKSNFVDALRFVHQSDRFDVHAAIAARNGKEKLLAGRQADLVIKFDNPHAFIRISADKSSTKLDSSYIGEDLNWLFSNPLPHIIRELSQDDLGELLYETSENIASIVQSAEQTEDGREGLSRILSAMQVISPDLVAIRTESLASYVLVLFDYQRSNGEKVTFDPRSLSDGTLRIFAILVALYLRNGAELIVIEEPELNIHPVVITVLTDCIKEVSELAQIIITTHSPELIDQFKPEQIRVVEMIDGQTHISPLHPAQQEAVKEGLLNLSGFMLAQGLLPDEPLQLEEAKD